MPRTTYRLRRRGGRSEQTLVEAATETDLRACAPELAPALGPGEELILEAPDGAVIAFYDPWAGVWLPA